MRPLPIITLVLALLLGWLWFGWQPPEPTGHDLDADAPWPVAGDFTLDAAQGPVSLADFRGRVVLLYFGYTACPDICPTNLAMLGAALRALEPHERARVRVLFVSLDPERDNALHLRDYAAYFHPEIIGLTGTTEQIAEVATAYGVIYRRAEDTESAMGYTIDHSAYTYLIDADGKLAQRLDHATPAERIVATLRAALP